MLILNPDTYRLLARPLLFSLPPETAQGVADFVLKRRPIWRALSPVLQVSDPRLAADLSGLRLKNPVGLAAGYDKNCEFLPSMAAMGFGYVVGGTVTESPRPGNPRPRVLRYVEDQSLINALGFPSKGLDYAAKQLERGRNSFGDTPVVISVAGVTASEIARCHRRLEPLADAIEINISSPNTAGLRIFQEAPTLAELVGRIGEWRQKPLFVKMPPYSTEEDRERVLGLARVCVDAGVGGLTVANTHPAQDSRLAVGSGGLSGKLVFGDMLRMVADISSEVGDRIAINACGGIFTGEDAWRALQSGATTVQLLTGLIYRGPGIVRQMNRELVAIMEGEDVRSAPSTL